METTVKVLLVNAIESGVSKSGNEWKKQSFVGQTQEQYPRKIFFTIFGVDRVDGTKKIIKEDKVLDVKFDLESREYNGRWYTDVNVWDIHEHIEDAVTSAQREDAAIIADAEKFDATPTNEPTIF